MSSVQISTFLKWNLSSFGYETKTINERVMVTKIWCKVCRPYIDKIKADKRIRGKAQKDIEAYVTGSSYVTKHTATRHIWHQR